MYYLNLYFNYNINDLVLKQVENRHAYKGKLDWLLLQSYIIYDGKLYKYEDFRELRKTRKFNFWEKLVIFFREL